MGFLQRFEDEIKDSGGVYEACRPDNPKVTVGLHKIGATLEMKLEIALAAINCLARPVSDY